MYDVNASAVRQNGMISVTVTGNLPDSSYEASIADIYPGGNIIYVMDPGSAQVFIEETTSGVGLMVLVPWAGHADIPDEYHDRVTVLVNGESVAEAPVQSEPERFQVIALTGTKNKGCSVIPVGVIYLAIYEVVFGPATKAACEEWLMGNCTDSPKIKSPA